MCPPQLLLASFFLCFRSRVQGHSHAVPLGLPGVPLGSVQQSLEAAQLQLLLGGQQWVVCIGLCVIVVLPA
jgi:hypothetical protein